MKDDTDEEDEAANVKIRQPCANPWITICHDATIQFSKWSTTHSILVQCPITKSLDFQRILPVIKHSTTKF